MERRAHRREGRRAWLPSPWRVRRRARRRRGCRKPPPAPPRCRWPRRRLRPSAASAAMALAASRSRPISAAIAPAPTGTASCMARPRVRSRRAASPTVSAAGGGERRILAERMTGDIGDAVLEIDSPRLEHAERGEADRHQGRLGVLGQRQGLGRSLPDHAPTTSRRARRRPRRRRPRPPGTDRRALCPCRPPGCPGPEK